jgi:hypothetical protein
LKALLAENREPNPEMVYNVVLTIKRFFSGKYLK